MATLTTTMLLIHVCCAVVSLLAGGMAMVFRKGGGLHRASGAVFFFAMLLGTTAAISVATLLRPNAGNTIGSTLVFYLIVTSWMTIKRGARVIGAFDYIALILGLTIGITGLVWGAQAAATIAGGKDGYGAPFFFIFGSIALSFAISDIRMLIRGGVAGAQRIGRHLWRMSLALLMALMSFYPGQARLFSKAVRETNLLYVPHVLVLGAALLWLARIARRKRAERPRSEFVNVSRADLTPTGDSL